MMPLNCFVDPRILNRRTQMVAMRHSRGSFPRLDSKVTAEKRDPNGTTALWYQTSIADSDH